MLLSDIRYALRRIAHRPRTSAVVAVTLALGIGATTAVFSVVDAVLLAPLPYAAPERLVGVYEMSNDGVRVRRPTSWAGLEAWRARTTAFEHLAAYKNVSLNLGADEGAEQVSGVRVTADMLATLGLAPALGRGFEPSEEVEGAPPV